MGGKPLHEYTESVLERAFVADEKWKGSDLSLLFEDFGMSQNATVYFNGREIARFDDGFDKEAVLQPADIRYGDWNFVTVRLEDEGGRWNWRGIKGDVHLQAKPKTRIEFPAVRTFVKEGKISFEALVKNNTGSAKKLVLRAAVEGENAPEKLESEPFEIGAGEEKQVAFSAEVGKRETLGR